MAQLTDISILCFSIGEIGHIYIIHDYHVKIYVNSLFNHVWKILEKITFHYLIFMAFKQEDWSK